MGEFREHLNLEVNPVSHDRFEILAITAGVANGWEFPAEVLRESLALWEGVNCFVDHSLSARSVRDIAGVLRDTRWDEEVSGVRAELTSFGPSAKVLAEIGRQVLEASDEPAVRVGFSADILFKGKAGKVEKILKIYSVDLVYNPARGGIFLRALNQLGIEPLQIGGKRMELNQNNDQAGLQAEIIPAQAALPAPELQEQLSEMRAMRSEMSTYLLEGSLANTRLPVGMQQRIRSQFQGRILRLPNSKRHCARRIVCWENMTAPKVCRDLPALKAWSSPRSGCRQPWMTCLARRVKSRWFQLQCRVFRASVSSTSTPPATTTCMADISLSALSWQPLLTSAVWSRTASTSL
jgi:hypothetical protein